MPRVKYPRVVERSAGRIYCGLQAHSIRNTGSQALEIMIVGIAAQKGVLETVEVN